MASCRVLQRNFSHYSGTMPHMLNNANSFGRAGHAAKKASLLGQCLCGSFSFHGPITELSPTCCLTFLQTGTFRSTVCYDCCRSWTGDLWTLMLKLLFSFGPCLETQIQFRVACGVETQYISLSSYEQPDVPRCSEIFRIPTLGSHLQSRRTESAHLLLRKVFCPYQGRRGNAQHSQCLATTQTTSWLS